MSLNPFYLLVINKMVSTNMNINNTINYDNDNNDNNNNDNNNDNNSTKNKFDTLKIPIPNIVYSYEPNKQEEIYQYLSQLDELQKKAYLIANDHLGSSFNIYKSNGFTEWKKGLK